MKAQSFFEACNKIVGSSINQNAKKLTSFGKEVEEDFVDSFTDDLVEVDFAGEDFEEDFKSNSASSNHGAPPTVIGITSVNVERVAESDISALSGYFFHFLESDLRSVTSGDYKTTWNANFRDKVESHTDALCAFVKMLFNVELSGFALDELEDLLISDLRKLECSLIPVTDGTLKPLVSIVDAGFSIFEYTTLCKFGVAEIMGLMSRDVYDFEEATKYLVHRNVFEVYKRLILNGSFNSDKLDKLIDSVPVHSISSEELYDLYCNSNEGLVELVRYRDKSIIDAVYCCPPGVIDYTWLSKHRNNAFLKELISARKDGHQIEWFEELSSGLPRWAIESYLNGEFDDSTADSVWKDFIVKELRTNVPQSYNSSLSNEDAFKLLWAKRKGFIDYSDIRKFFLLSCYRDFSFGDDRAVPFNQYFFKKLAAVIGKEYVVHSRVSTCLLISDSSDRLMLSDSFSLAMDFDKYYKKLLVGEFHIGMLNNNAGMFVCAADFADHIAQFRGYRYVAKSSVEVWADSVDTFDKEFGICGDVLKLNVSRVIKCFGKDNACDELLSLLKGKQQGLTDRCLDFVLQNHTYALPALNSKNCNLVLHSMVPHVTIQRKFMFTLRFLMTLLRRLDKLQLGNISGQIAINRVHVEFSNGFTKDSTMDALFLATDAFIELFNSASCTILSVEDGAISIKLVK